MSRIGLKTVTVPSGVTIEVDDNNLVRVKGPKGELQQPVYADLTISQEDGSLNVARSSEKREHRSQHGLARTLIDNMVVGVSSGFEKKLEVHGVGYRAVVEGRDLVLTVGYSHPVRLTPPEGVTFAVGQEDRSRITKITVSGIDKQKVGQVAADVRKVRKPDPYKGKGVRYAGEVIKLRQGKRASA
ncbi:MAG: 50S ribosomal protein L6 [Armatimonadota bacterium]|nr:50S ribosomal protein L6 [Armatimonadota bacterium]